MTVYELTVLERRLQRVIVDTVEVICTRKYDDDNVEENIISNLLCRSNSIIIFYCNVVNGPDNDYPLIAAIIFKYRFLHDLSIILSF